MPSHETILQLHCVKVWSYCYHAKHRMKNLPEERPTLSPRWEEGWRISCKASNQEDPSGASQCFRNKNQIAHFRNASKECCLAVAWAAFKDSSSWVSFIYNNFSRNGKVDRETASHFMNARSASIPTLLHCPELTILCHLIRIKLFFWPFLKMSLKNKSHL